MTGHIAKGAFAARNDSLNRFIGFAENQWGLYPHAPPRKRSLVKGQELAIQEVRACGRVNEQGSMKKLGQRGTLYRSTGP